LSEGAPPPPDSASSAAELARGRASAAIALGRFEEAVRQAGRAVAAEPAAIEGYGLLAQALIGQNEMRRAQEAAEQGLSHGPDSEWLLRLRATALFHQGDAKGALAGAEAALAVLPASALAHSLRGKSLGKLKREKEALAALEKSIELAPQTAHLHRDLGDLLLRKEPKLAEARYRAALELTPNDAVALNNLGVALQRQKRHEEAAHQFRAAILADPTMKVAKTNAHSTIGALGRRAGVTGAVLALYLAASLLRAYSSSGADEQRPFWVSLLLLVAMVALIAVALGMRHRATEAAKKRQDPQLAALYERLDSDKKRGQL